MATLTGTAAANHIIGTPSADTILGYGPPQGWSRQ